MSFQLIKLSGWMFGIPIHEIRIPAGFEVIANEGEFLQAKQGEKRFYVVEFPRFFKLFPVEKSPINPKQKCARMDRAIRIGKE